MWSLQQHASSCCTRQHRTPAASFVCQVAQADDVYMQEYASLKDSLLNTTRKAGGGIALYFLLTLGGQAAIFALIGSAFSNLYLLWLFYDVDNVKPTDRVALFEAQKIDNTYLRKGAELLAAYKHALNPRLSVLIILAALTGLYNQSAEQPLAVLDQGCLLVGFLSYKVALIIKLVDDLSPKKYNEESYRPKLDVIEDELDKWGRPKSRTPLPTAALPEDVEPEKLPVLPQLVKALDDEPLESSSSSSTSSKQ